MIVVNNTLSPLLKSRPAIAAFALFGTVPPAVADVSTNSLPVLAAVRQPARDQVCDTFGLAGLFNGISRVHQEFFEAGGTGILGGDGTLNYGWEKVLETYYDFKIWKTIRAAVDCQFVTDPAFNRDRGPVSVFGARLHWEF